MRKCLALFVIFIFMGILGCGSSPSGTVKDFYKYVEKGEVNKASDLLSKPGKELLNQLGGANNALMHTNEDISKKGGIKNIEILNEDTKGDISNIKCQITYGNGSTKIDSEKLIKEDGKWKIAVSK